MSEGKILILGYITYFRTENWKIEIKTYKNVVHMVSIQENFRFRVVP